MVRRRDALMGQEVVLGSGVRPPKGYQNHLLIVIVAVASASTFAPEANKAEPEPVVFAKRIVILPHNLTPDNAITQGRDNWLTCATWPVSTGWMIIRFLANSAQALQARRLSCRQFAR